MGKRAGKIALFKPLDAIVIALLLAASVYAAVALRGRSDGDFIRIEKEGEVVALFPITEDNFYTSEGNTVAVVSGVARMDSANCPDKLCVEMGAISRAGESIICLPNRVAVTVVSDDTSLDGVTG